MHALPYTMCTMRVQVFTGLAEEDAAAGLGNSTYMCLMFAKTCKDVADLSNTDDPSAIECLNCRGFYQVRVCQGA
jgi:hypothetical protein